MSQRLATDQDYKAIAIKLLSVIKERPVLLGGYYGGDRERFLERAIVIHDDKRTIDAIISLENDETTARKIVELQGIVKQLKELDDSGHDRWNGVAVAIERATTDSHLAGGQKVL